MATKRIPILGFATSPGDSGNVFFEPADVKATTAPWKGLVGIFNDTATRDGLHGRFPVPKDYVGTANLIVVWTVNATTGDVEWDFDYRATGGNDTESRNQAGTQEALTGNNDTAPSVAFERLELSIALTDGNFAADDDVDFALYRDGTDAGDTLAADVILVSLFFEYNDA